MSQDCSGWGRRSGGWHRFTSSTPLITYVASFTRADRVVRAVAGQRELHVFFIAVITDFAFHLYIVVVRVPFASAGFTLNATSSRLTFDHVLTWWALVAA